MKSWVEELFPSGVGLVLLIACAVAIVSQTFTINTYITSEIVIPFLYESTGKGRKDWDVNFMLGCLNE